MRKYHALALGFCLFLIGLMLFVERMHQDEAAEVALSRPAPVVMPVMPAPEALPDVEAAMPDNSDMPQVRLYAEGIMVPGDLTFMDGERELGVAFRHKHGKLLLVNLWATWCAPCVAEMDSLDSLQAALGGDDFEVIAISLDADPEVAVPAFFEAEDIQHLHFYYDLNGDVPSAFGWPGLPMTYLINADGRRIGDLYGPADWNSPQAHELLQRYLPSSSEAE